MQLSNIPGKLVLPFANAGGKSTIPVASQIGITAGAASLTDGFPPLTRTPIAAGGVPPSGLDMNGILYEMSAIIRWANAGGGYPFDGTFAADSNVGGYPKGARIMRSDGLGYWFNTIDNNVTDPEGAGAVAAGWVPDFTSGVSAITMTGSSVTLTPLQYGKPVIVITGTLTANLNLIFPTIPWQWQVVNATSGGYSITVKTATGTGVVLPQSFSGEIFGDGTNIYSQLASWMQVTFSQLSGYAALRAYSGNLTGFYLTGAAHIFDNAGGFFIVDPSDTTSVDDSGIVIVDAIGRRWKRNFSGSVKFDWYAPSKLGTVDISTALQSASNYAISIGNGEVECSGGNYLVANTVTLGSISAYSGGIKLKGPSPNSIGVAARFFQKDINIPVFKIDSVNTHLTGLAFTCWAGNSNTVSGTAIVAVSNTSNSITLSANPWNGGSPVIWTPVAPLVATDGTSYANVIQFSLQGSWYASSVTDNGNGTVTLNGVKGANGTLNSVINGTVGNPVNFVSLAHANNPALLTNPNAGIIYTDLRENQFFDHLWFNQVTRAFNYDATGSGGGPSTGTGNAGFMSDIVVDQAMNFIYAQGDINSLQISDSQFFGTGVSFYAPSGSFKSSNMSNCQQVIGKLIQCNNDIVDLVITGNSFNGLTGYGYSDFLINFGGTMQDCTIVGNNFGRSTTTVINGTSVDGTVFTGNDIISNSEGGSQPFIYLVSTLTNSYFGGNNFAAKYGSNSNRLGFSGATPNVSGSTFGGEFVHYQTGTKVIGWVPITSFINSWTNVAGGTQAVACFKDQNGIVTIKGALYGGASGSVAFTLPAGYRPNTGPMRFVAGACWNGSAQVPMLVDIASSGNVTIQSTVVSYGHLDTISFPAII